MDPQTAYEAQGQNLYNGYWVNDWHVYASLFVPQGVLLDGMRDGALENGEALFAMRLIAARDLASGFDLGFKPVPTRPAALCAGQVIEFLEHIADQRGLPRIGVVISHSCWLSSVELVADPHTADRGEVVLKDGLQFDGMEAEDKSLILDWAVERGVQLIFHAELLDRISEPFRR